MRVSPALFQTFFAGGGVAQEGPLSLTNVEKLSLPLDTAVGTQVAVSDGFYLTGISGDAGSIGAITNVFYKEAGIVNGKKWYSSVTLPSTTPGTDGMAFYWDGSSWIGLESQTVSEFAISSSDTTYPWEATWEDDGYGVAILTHPALQTLAAPDIAQGGVFIPEIGVCVISDDLNGKHQFALLGGTDPTATGGFLWSGTNQWNVYSSDGTYLYYSLSAVATPDLATNWKNASDDTPAAISVTSVSVGELAAGISYNGAIFSVSGSEMGRNKYVDVSSDPQTPISWDSTSWSQLGDPVLNLGNVAFPFDGTPEVPVLQDDIANEANWTATP